jgi:peroxiredoxin Q/BCP
MTTLSPGDLAPDFSLKDEHSKVVSLAGLEGRKLIIYVYPAAFTPGCSLEAQDFRDADSSFEKAGYTIFGLSPDEPSKNESFAEEMKLPFDLLSDPDHQTLEAYGAWGEKQAFGRTAVGVIRSTFVIGPDQRIEKAEYGVKAAGHVERLAEELGVTLEGF